MVDTTFTPARGYMQVVPRRNRATLTQIMNQRLAHPVIVHTDLWRGYFNLPNFVMHAQLHETVNHRFNFVDPITGAHTQVLDLLLKLSTFSQ